MINWVWSKSRTSALLRLLFREDKSKSTHHGHTGGLWFYLPGNHKWTVKSVFWEWYFLPTPKTLTATNEARSEGHCLWNRSSHLLETAYLLSCAPGKAGPCPALSSGFPPVSSALKLGRGRRATSQGPRHHHCKSKGTMVQLLCHKLRRQSTFYYCRWQVRETPLHYKISWWPSEWFPLSK